MIFKLYFIVVLTALFTFVRCTPINQDAQMCMKLCASCKGTATFADDKCECDLEEDGKEGAECLRRTRREVGDNGFNLISCDLIGDDRKTRCTLGSKHFRTRNSMDQVAKYFMKDGPITGSIFKAPHYSVRSKIHDCGEKSQIVSQPMDTVHRVSYVKASEYSAPPQQVIINIPQGYVPNGSPVTGSATPEAMTGSTHLIIQPKLAPAIPAEEVGCSQVITQPKEDMPEQIIGAQHIITQPTELIPPAIEPAEPEKPKMKHIQPIEPADHDAPAIVEVPKTRTSTFEIERPASIGLGKDCTSVRMVAIPKTITPLFMQSLLQHLSQPMLGIPQALQTITKAPGISQIVSAPGNLLNSLVSRLESSGGVGSKLKGGKGGNDGNGDNLKFTTNSQLFSQYDPDLLKLYVNPGDDFNTVLGSGNPYSIGVPSTHILVQPVSAYTTMPIVSDYSPCNREYVSQIPSYMVGSSLPMSYFDSDESYIPVYYDIPKMEHFTNEENDPKVEKSKTAEENTPTLTKEIFREVPVIKSKKICKKSSKDESLKKVTRDIKAVSESISDEITDTNEKNQDNVGITQATELPNIDRTTTQEPIIEKTPAEERKRSMTKISSKIKKSKGEKKSDVNKK